MFKSFFYRILQRRHFWRYATFSEVAEIYVSRTLRLSAVNLVAGFTSVYLYKLGYSLVAILSFWILYYLIRTLIAPFASILIARVGTMRGTLISNLLFIPAMVAFGFTTNLGVPMIVIYLVFTAVSNIIYAICYQVDFSIVKSPLHAGKEIGYMNIFEKFAITLSPVIGGFIALIFGPQVTMWVAGAMFAIAAVPLIVKKPVRSETKNRLTIRGFPWRIALPSIVAVGWTGCDVIASSVVWGLFVAIFIFPTYKNDIYVVLGVLSSVTVIVAMVTSISYGNIIDRRKGGNLLKIGVITNAIVHLSRVFAATPIGILEVNIVNEAATTAQNMALLRGEFDLADISGHRIVYLVGTELSYNIGAIIACIVMILCLTNIGGLIGFRVFFVFTAIAILGTGFARFPLYRK